MEKLTYSIPEFLELSGLRSRSAVYEEIGAGLLKTIKVGRRRLIPHSAAEEWLAQNEREPEKAALLRREYKEETDKRRAADKAAQP